MLKNSKKIKFFDSDALKNFHKRIFFSIIIFSCCYFISIFRISEIMIYDITKINEDTVKIQSDRGKIYDRNGQLLASNIQTVSLYVNPKKIKDKKNLSISLSSIINIESVRILKLLHLNKNFVYLKRNISPKEYQKILKLGKINLRTEIENKRVYPYKNIGSHIIGYVDIDNKGIAGIEGSYDNILSQGNDINLTININLQNAIRDQLVDTIKKFSADSGSALVMDIKTSEILSINNFPDFDLNNIKNSNLDQRVNRILQSNYEMGSTFKPLTIAMGIDENLIDKEMKFDVSKPIKNIITDWKKCDCYLSVKEIIVNSSNIGTAKIAKIIGKENQINFFKKIGFFDPININLMEIAKPFGQPYNWGSLETMTIGYGHGFAVTPLHLAVAYQAILNDGKKTNPKIILSDKNLEYSQIINKETSVYISQLLRAVIQETEYTGPRVKIEGYDIGGKTGTAELTNKMGKYDSDSNRTIFVAAFPMSDPKYLILTFIDKPKRIKDENYNITSATVNAPLVKKIILKMIQILNLPKNNNNSFLNAAISLKYNEENAFN